MLQFFIYFLIVEGRGKNGAERGCGRSCGRGSVNQPIKSSINQINQPIKSSINQIQEQKAKAGNDFEL